MQADNLLDAYNNFYYQEPLLWGPDPPRGRSSEFWVDREGNPFGELKAQLLASTDPIKLLFAGHRGSGKSTELNRLMAEEDVKNRFLIVYFTAKETLDLSDATYTDLLLATAGKIIVSAEKSGLRIPNSLATRISRWRGNVTEKLQQDDESWGADAGLGLSAFFGKFLLRLKRESKTRNVVRQVVESQVSELMEMLVALVGEVNLGLSGTRRQLLVVVEDLDKIELEDAQKLFQNSGPYIAELPFTAVFTVPIALHYHPIFNGIVRAFGTSVLLPNVRLWDRDDPQRSLQDAGLSTLRQFVEKRMAPGLIEEEALKEAIRMSGGMMRDLAWILRDACNRARVRNHERINRDIVLATVSEIRAAYDRQLSDQAWAVLDQVAASKIPDGSDTCLELLNSLHILEFRNDDRWCDIHPVLQRPLDRWRMLRRS